MIESQVVSRYYIHSAPANNSNENDERIISFTNKIDADSCCGNISPYYFSVNLPFFMEARQFNSCLYRKIAIDQKGNIKNCPSLPATFGHIETTGFLEVIDHLAFRELWHINKDQINTCKDCEFRYICSDCRAFLSNSKDKPAKCNYNPYTNIYENQ
jgi:SPASM domain peptide maturase of grasp-with-spasm system